jgi:hypothetical protein
MLKSVVNATDFTEWKRTNQLFIKKGQRSNEKRSAKQRKKVSEAAKRSAKQRKKVSEAAKKRPTKRH